MTFIVKFERKHGYFIKLDDLRLYEMHYSITRSKVKV